MDIHIRTGALLPAFSPCLCRSLGCFFLLLSLIQICILYCVVLCVLMRAFYVCVCNVPVHSECEPIFRAKIRYSANVTLSIRHQDDCVDLALFSYKHAHNPIHHISITFFCCSMRVFHCRPQIFGILPFGLFHGPCQRERIEGCRSCNLSLAYFLSFQ